MSIRPDISIITLNCNGLTDTRACLHSIMEHTHVPYEVIVWDNGSVAEQYAALQTEFGDRIQLERSQRNVGVAAGYNRAAEHAHGRFLVFINNDAVVTEGWLEPLLAVMESDAAIGACQPKILSLLDPTSFDYCGACGGFLDRHGYPFLRGRLFSHVERDAGQYDDIIDIHWASAACMIVRADAWFMLGGADESFFAYMDEVDFCCRLRNAGYRICNVPSSVVYHIGSRVLGKRPFRKRFLEHRNNLLLLAKNMDLQRLVRILPQRMLLDCCAMVLYVSRGDWWHFFAVPCALISFLLRLPAVLMRRKKTQTYARFFSHSIIVAFFFRGIRTFSGLKRE